MRAKTVVTELPPCHATLLLFSFSLPSPILAEYRAYSDPPLVLSFEFFIMRISHAWNRSLSPPSSSLFLVSLFSRTSRALFSRPRATCPAFSRRKRMFSPFRGDDVTMDGFRERDVNFSLPLLDETERREYKYKTGREGRKLDERRRDAGFGVSRID